MHRKNNARMHMVGSIKILGIGLVSTALIYSGPPAGPGYLARVGPAPLRFQADTPQINPALVLPPLKMDDEPPAVSSDEPEPKAPEQPQSEGVRSDSGEVSPLPGEIEIQVGGVSTNAPPAAGQQSISGLSPQMLLQYFNRPTNQNTFISVPVEFTPPSAPVTRGSSATYISR